MSSTCPHPCCSRNIAESVYLLPRRENSFLGRPRLPITMSSSSERHAKQLQALNERLHRASSIRNKAKKLEVMSKIQREKKLLSENTRKKRKREREELGDKAPPKQVPKTIDSMRKHDETTVEDNDEEVQGDEDDDEFAPYFKNEKVPKIMITTRPRPSKHLFKFVQGLIDLIPNMFFYPRRQFTVKEICQYAHNAKFTHLIVLSEKSKVCNGMIISHLPEGPTAQFKVTSIVEQKHIKNHGRVTNHLPEIILNNFTTRLGHRVGRFLGSLFPHDPEFLGRKVVTFHNQRDFIFVRHHRYIFEEDKRNLRAPQTGVGSSREEQRRRKRGTPIRAKMQELGPQFCLKMRWLQASAFNTKGGEYEWFHKQKEMGKDRKTFYL